MEPGLLSNDEQRKRNSRIWLVLCLCGLVFLIVARGSSNSHRQVTLRLNANGVISVGGISMGNATVRRLFFKCLNFVNVKAEIEIHSTNASNVIQTVREVREAGLFETASRAGTGSGALLRQSPPTSK